MQFMPNCRGKCIKHLFFLSFAQASKGFGDMEEGKRKGAGEAKDHLSFTN